MTDLNVKSETPTPRQIQVRAFTRREAIFVETSTLDPGLQQH